MRNAARPNVVVVLADDMGYGDFGLFNEARSSTPHLNRLAAEGVCLTQCYAGAPVCAPSRAAFLTGRYPQRTGAIDTLHGRGLDRIALSESTIADCFRAAGYRTGLVGKWHNGALDPRFHPNARGFEEFAGFSGGLSDYWDWALDMNGAEVPGDGRYLTDVLSGLAIDYVKRHAREAFLLVLAYNAPHFPMQAPQEFVDRYLAAGETLGAALTYAMVEVMDDGIGKLDEALDALGLAENTIVVFTSDNGPYLGEVEGVSLERFNYGLRGAKHYVYEGGIRVPAIVRWPSGLNGGQMISETVQFTDWLPTLAGAAGVALPPSTSLDGVDLRPAFAGEEIRQERFWQSNRYAPHGGANAAMRDGAWKLVRPADPALMTVTERDRELDRALNYRRADRITSVDTTPLPVFQPGAPQVSLLFDLNSDPFEETDLAAEHPSRVRHMSEALDRWFESVERDRHAAVAAGDLA